MSAGWRWGAVAVAMIAPGAGHAMLGRWLRGSIFVAAMLGLLLAIPVLGIFGILGGLLAHMAGVFDVARLRVGEQPPRNRLLLGLGVTAVAGIGGVVMLRTFYLGSYRVPAGGMSPTVLPGDIVMVEKAAYWFASPERGDIIVFRYPENRDVNFVKRVVGIPGDRIAIQGRVLILNGTATEHGQGRPCSFPDRDEVKRLWIVTEAVCVEEVLGTPHQVAHLARPPGGAESHDEVVVPERHYYVMGDNRDNSHDSRYWGFVPQTDIIGKVSFIWWSKGKQGTRWSRLGERP